MRGASFNLFIWKHVCFLSWLSLLATATIFARQSTYLIDHWERQDGLPQNSVTAITQTPDGYLWLGTFNGLVRFDGVRFVHYHSQNTPELASNRIVHLHRDASQNLWIVSEYGDLTKWREGRFQALGNVGPVAGLADINPGEVWIGAAAGLFRWVRGEPEPAPVFAELLPGGVQAVAADEEGRLWIQAESSLFQVTAEGLRQPGRTRGRLQVDLLHPKRGGGLWMPLGNRLRQLHPDGSILEASRMPWSQSWTFALLEDRAGNLWIGSGEHGLFRMTPDGAWLNFTSADGLGQNAIRAIYEDVEGSIWIGTDGGGLNRLKPGVFRVYNTADGLDNEIVYSVSEGAGGVLWIGTHGGGVYQLKDGRLRRFLGTPAVPSFVWSLLEDRSGNFWVGTYGYGLLRYQEQFGEGVALPHAQQNVTFTYAMMEDSRRRVWFGGPHGLTRYQDGEFVTFHTRDGLSHNVVRALAEDPSGAVWIGTEGGGLNRYQDGSFIHFTTADGLAHNSVSCLYVDSNGVLWIGTRGGGLSRFHDGGFTTYSRDTGLHDNDISSILEDDFHWFWFSSLNGISRVHRSQLEAVAHGGSTRLLTLAYDETDGLKSRECTGGSQPGAWKTGDGRLWFSTVRGLAVADPGTLTLNTNAPPVVIEEIFLDGLPHAPLPASTADPVLIPPGTQRVEFHFTALSFLAPSRVRFRFKLEGYDRDWIDSGSARFAQYTGIPPGQYTFQVIAANNDGIWNTAGAAVPLRVVPAFHQTSWFQALILAALLGGMTGSVWLFFRWKWRRKLHAVERRHAVERERLRIAGDMHDDLGGSLTQIAILSDLARQRLDDPSAAEPLLSQIAHSARQTTRHLEELVWAVHPDNDTLDHLADYLCQFAGEFFRPTPTRCRLDLPPSIQPALISSELRHNIFLIVKETFHNILKHAQASEVWLRLQSAPSHFQITIQDNGRGFDARRPDPQANGLANIERRVEIIGGQFTIHSRQCRGTTLTIRFPIPPSITS